MIHKFQEVNWHPNRAERRKFGLSLMLGLPCSGLLLLLLTRLGTGSWKLTVPVGIAGGGFVLGLTLFLLPAIALPFYRVWFALVCVIDFVVTHVLLFLSYYALIVPAGLICQWLAPGAFPKHPDRSRSTYWNDIEPVKDVRRYYQQF